MQVTSHLRPVSKMVKRNGHGVHIYKNKDKYDGNWKNNKRHGQGEMTYANHGGSSPFY